MTPASLSSTDDLHNSIRHSDLTCRELRLIGVGLGGDIDTTEPLLSFSLGLERQEKGTRRTCTKMEGHQATQDCDERI